MEFKILAQDKKGRARAGILRTLHGRVETPTFVPVGTQGTVKSLTPQDLGEIGTQIILANTYHLYLRPGVEVIEKLGGLHKFMNWSGPLMTDSGGFQIFSLPSLVKIDDDGVTFRSHIDGSLLRFTPEKSMEIQQKLGADIILAFDECPPYGVKKEVVRKATERTHQWAIRSVVAASMMAGPAARQPHAYPARLTRRGPPRGAPRLASPATTAATQTLFGIIQGGVFKDLREESAKFIASLPFDGIAIGGVAVGESKKEMREVLDWVIPHLPEEKPRHLLGVGEIDDIFAAVERGVDMFDCVMPTRLGRMGHTLTQVQSSKFKVQSFTMDITKSVFAGDPRPPVEDCGCYTCRNFSRAYLNHLFRAKELLAYRLATYHNLYFMSNLMRQIKEAILADRFTELKRKWQVSS